MPDDDRADPSLVNADLRPTRRDQRTWTVQSIASLWVGMAVCVPTYMLASSMVQEGMAWWQAVLTVLLGNAIVLLPMLMIGHPGTKYGINFPVLARASFGTRGAHIPSMLRALVACGWFGIQTWVGGAAIYQLLNAATGDALAGEALPLLGINLAELACFLVFWLLQVAVIWRGTESIRVLETWAAPFLIAMGLALLLWAWLKAGGFGPMLSKPSAFRAGGPREGEFWEVFFPSLTAMVGFWATLALNIPDFTRFSKSQKDQMLGQAIGLPPTMALFAFISIAVTSATVVIFGESIWDPTILLGRMGGGVAVIFSLAALAIATMSTNIAANVVSPANAFINVAPRFVSFRVGGMITAGLGIAIFPWKLLETSGAYIHTWLIGYSALLGPIGGILIGDYFFYRRRRLDPDALFRHDGPYGYWKGINPVAVGALVLSVAPNLPGFLEKVGIVESVPAIFSQIYTYAWFVGFLLGGFLYVGGMRLFAAAPATPPPVAAAEVASTLPDDEVPR